MIPDVAACVADLVAQLEAARDLDQDDTADVYGYVPEEPSVPCYIVQGAEDVIRSDHEDVTQLGEYLVSLDVVILVELDGEHDNQAATEALWKALQTLATALEGSDWTLSQVNQPGTLQTLYWQHHGVTATVRTLTE